MPLSLHSGFGQRHDTLWFKSNVRAVRRQGLSRSGSFGRLALQLQRRDTYVAPRELALTEEAPLVEPVPAKQNGTQGSDAPLVTEPELHKEHHVKHAPTVWWNPLTWAPRTRGLILLNILVLLAATNWVVVKDVEESFDAVTFAAIRFSVAAIAFAPFIYQANSATWRSGVELGTWSALGYIFQAQGLITTDASRASFLSTFTVLIVPFLAAFTGEKLTPVTWASAFTAIVGVYFLENGGSPPGVGDIWSILSAVAFAVQIWRTEAVSKHLRDKGGNVPSLMAVVVFTIALISCAIAVAQHASSLPDLVTSALAGNQWHLLQSVPWPAVIWTALFSTDLLLLIEVLHLLFAHAACMLVLERPLHFAGAIKLV
eukprot:jgi/Botrbrau1/20379/Bobra.0006s0041.2